MALPFGVVIWMFVVYSFEACCATAAVAAKKMKEHCGMHVYVKITAPGGWRISKGCKQLGVLTCAD